MSLLNHYSCLEGGHLAFNLRQLDFGWSLFMDTQLGSVESGPSLKAIGWCIERSLFMDTQVGSEDSGPSCWFLKVPQDRQSSNDRIKKRCCPHQKYTSIVLGTEKHNWMNIAHRTLKQKIRVLIPSSIIIITTFFN